MSDVTDSRTNTADQADAADRRGDVAIAELLLSTALRLAESVFSPADVPSAP